MFENKDIMQTSSYAFAFLPKAEGGGGTIGFMAAVGYHLLRSPCLCLYFVSWSW